MSRLQGASRRRGAASTSHVVLYGVCSLSFADEVPTTQFTNVHMKSTWQSAHNCCANLDQEIRTYCFQLRLLDAICYDVLRDGRLFGPSVKSCDKRLHRSHDVREGGRDKSRLNRQIFAVSIPLRPSSGPSDCGRARFPMRKCFSQTGGFDSAKDFGF